MVWVICSFSRWWWINHAGSEESHSMLNFRPVRFFSKHLRLAENLQESEEKISSPAWGFLKNGGTQQPWVFLLKTIILRCEMGVPPFNETPTWSSAGFFPEYLYTPTIFGRFSWILRASSNGRVGFFKCVFLFSALGNNPRIWSHVSFQSFEATKIRQLITNHV